MKKLVFLKGKAWKRQALLFLLRFSSCLVLSCYLKDFVRLFKSLLSIYTCKLLIKLRNVFKQSTIHFIFLILLFMLYISSNMFLFLQKQVMQTLISFFLLQARPSFLFLYIISSYYHFVYALFKPLI